MTSETRFIIRIKVIIIMIVIIITIVMIIFFPLSIMLIKYCCAP